MMEFLNTLFSYEYFGPILFAVIAILIVIFFIILFFGKKDEKERKLEETRRLEELANINAFKEEVSEEKVEIENSNMPMLETASENDAFESLDTVDTVFGPNESDVETKEVSVIDAAAIRSFDLTEDDNIDTNDVNEPVLTPISELPLITECEVDIPIEEVKVIEEEKEDVPFKIEPSIPINVPRYNFEELANSISKELEEIERLSYKKPEKEKIVSESKVELEHSHIEVTPIKEIQKKGSVPVFSSVFVPNENNVEEKPELDLVINDNSTETGETIFEEEVKPVQKDNPEVKNDKIDFSKLKSDTVNIVKPNVDLPKHIEMPKKVETVKNETIAPDFSNIEGESYDLK